MTRHVSPESHSSADLLGPHTRPHGFDPNVAAAALDAAGVTPVGPWFSLERSLGPEVWSHACITCKPKINADAGADAVPGSAKSQPPNFDVQVSTAFGRPAKYTVL